ncbi:hypothetical protein HHI36_006370 [Cryptolaemus montrouzieri]|uniref:Protein lethal(3)malignant blood neoplasm 1 n=1 Tax=Cryptolaemus montrouzieri TaxID=559131 RepID=A0ABD2NWW1_9CUCU
MEHKIITILALAFLLGDPTNGKVKDPDEDRAYEFGFTIEGMQHRHEKKDVNGIIQGEFGFITADGVYHVTVYATDENGNFRILSMKNIKVSPPLDGSPDFGSTKYSPVPKGTQAQSQQPKASLQPVQVQKRTDVSTTKAPQKAFTTQPTLKPACAGCGYVTTSKKPPTALPNVYQQFGGIDPAGVPRSEFPSSGSVGPDFPSSGGVRPEFPSSGIVPSGALPNSQLSVSKNVEPPKTKVRFQQNTIPGIIGNGNIRTGPAGVVPSSIISDNQDSGNVSPGSPAVISSYSDSFSNVPNDQNEVLGPRKSSQHTSHITYRNPESPVKVSDGLIKIPGNPDIPIKDKYPGMVDGLPAGVNEKDITDILYRFNWTVGFQGHYETGYKNGAKVGGYFVNGSDGISRVVTYVADEFGYRPKVRIINIGLDSADTPKDDKTFELKSFEFVWYPVK